VPKTDDVAVLQATLDAVEQSGKGNGVLDGLVDPTRVVTSGHSAGAGAAYKFASADPRVKAWISYSVGLGGRGGPPPAAPKKPGMVMLGTTDGIIEPTASQKVYAGMNSPKYLVRVGKGGHLVFSDICLIGRSAGGITAIAKALELPIPPELLKLGSDGCTSDHPPVEKAFPAIDQLTVAFFRNALGIDSAPVGLDTEAVKGLGADVTVESDTATSARGLRRALAHERDGPARDPHREPEALRVTEGDHAAVGGRDPVAPAGRRHEQTAGAAVVRAATDVAELPSVAERQHPAGLGQHPVAVPSRRALHRDDG
jgi:hypothetical protein